MPLNLSELCIKPRGEIFRNLPAIELAQKALERGEVQSSNQGALVVYTGKYTGRSPKDKFIVDDAVTHGKVDWGSVNRPISEDNFEKLYRKMGTHLSAADGLFVFDGFAGADNKYKLPIRVISPYAYQALFSHNMFLRPSAGELLQHAPQLTVLVAPECTADPKTDGTNSETFIVLHPGKMLVLIGGTKYSGEIKKSVFSILNFLLPERGVFPMHCSANMGENGETALFFGLSGTGKTTLSADLARRLIGDDEHGWSENGIFNFEGGCYAKCINLKQEAEPQIWGAVRDGALLENVVLCNDGSLDFADESITENTRASYPLDFIEHAVAEGTGGHPQYIIFLTADAFGVFPPVARLNTEAAMYHFLSGYTARLAGTERGVTDPQAVFSECFGAPFMPKAPIIYAELLRHYMKKYGSRVYLVNTGWMGGPYGVGHRISIKDTRAIVSAVLSGKLDKADFASTKPFNLEIPKLIEGINSNILNPRNIWSDKDAYDQKAEEVARLFVENFRRFKGVDETIIQTGPKL